MGDKTRDEMDEALDDLGAFLAECRKATDDGDVEKAIRMMGLLEEMMVVLERSGFLKKRKKDPFDVKV